MKVIRWPVIAYTNEEGSLALSTVALVSNQRPVDVGPLILKSLEMTSALLLKIFMTFTALVNKELRIIAMTRVSTMVALHLSLML